MTDGRGLAQDGRADGRTDERTDGRMNGRTRDGVAQANKRLGECAGWMKSTTPSSVQTCADALPKAVI